MRRLNRAWAGHPLLITTFVTCSVVAAIMFTVDEPLAWYFATELDPSFKRFFATVTKMANGGIWYGVALIGFAVCWVKASRSKVSALMTRYKRYARAWTFMIVSMAASALILNFLKLAIGRYRPRYLFNDDLSGFEPFNLAIKMSSFPSGHAQSIWAAMMALSMLTPRYAPLYMVTAIVVSASRFVTSVHFVSDVIMGGFISIAVAVLMRRYFERNGESVMLRA